jgi:cellulose synthase (UDP-forming)
MKQRSIIRSGKVNKVLLIANAIMALVYFSWWFVPSHVGNPVLYGLLIFGELYHVIMALGFWFTIYPGKERPSLVSLENKKFAPSVDIFITVAGEPVDIIRQTAIAAKNIAYKKKTIYILNDGFVAKKDNWKEVEELAKELKIHCITRRIPGGSKAGNINNALKQTKGEFILIFDADMIAYSDFLQKTLPYFQDKKVAFVQTPQYYQNHKLNEVTKGSWEQMALFYGPVMIGKEKDNAAFIGGTNVVIRKKALEEVGGMYEESIAEDFLTSLFIHQRGWKSYYISEVLTEGLAPEDLLSYFKQQLRWARGSLEVLFAHNPLFKKGLTWGQKFQYLTSALYYLNGVIILIDCLMPIIFLLTGIQPVAATTTSFALFFIPFMFLNLYTLYVASGESITFRAISFNQAIWTLQLRALISVLFKQKMGFSVTSKQAQEGNYLFLVYPHIAYILVTIIAVVYRVRIEGIDPSVMTNVAWSLFNTIMFVPFIWAAFPWKKLVGPSVKEIVSEI